MPYSPVMYSSATELWATPQPVFDTLHAEFGFTIDVCAVEENAKCPRFFSPEQNGLMQKWGGRHAPEVCWMNPPYGKDLPRWIEKACRSSREDGATVVCLIPARTDTRVWHDVIFPHAAEIRYLRGRLKFGGAMNSAPFPSAVIVFRPPTLAGSEALRTTLF